MVEGIDPHETVGCRGSARCADDLATAWSEDRPEGLERLESEFFLGRLPWPLGFEARTFAREPALASGASVALRVAKPRVERGLAFTALGEEGWVHERKHLAFSPTALAANDSTTFGVLLEILANAVATLSAARILRLVHCASVVSAAPTICKGDAV